MDLNFKLSPFWLHHEKKLRTELTNMVEDNKSFLSDWTLFNISLPQKQIPVYVSRKEKAEVEDHMIMARKKKIPCCPSHLSPKRWPVKPISGNFQSSYIFNDKKARKNPLIGKTKNNQELLLTVPNIRSILQILNFYTENYNQHRLIFRDHWKKTCLQINLNWEDSVESILALRK